MDMTDVVEFVKEYKYWCAVAVPVVIAIIVVKILGYSALSLEASSCACWYEAGRSGTRPDVPVRGRTFRYEAGKEKKVMGATAKRSVGV